jgi:glycerophosphoryl diester phosphodiesterase
MADLSRGRRPLLLGHRGARLAAPENSLPAFDLALAHGCDGFEFDVRRTADGRSILCHDPRLAGLEIAAATYDSIQQFYDSELMPAVIANQRGAFPEACRLLCLEDVLERYRESAFLDIELKVPRLEDAVVSALKENPPRRGYTVSSFLPEVLEALRALDASLPLGFICDKRRQLNRWRTLPIEIVLPQRSLVSRNLIEEAHAAGKQVFVWTVNDQFEMWKLAGWGVDGLVSDDTQLLARTFATSP